MSNIDEMIRILIQSNRKICAREIGLFATKEVEIAKLSVLALGLLSLAVFEDEVGIMPSDWLNESAIPNPNFILQCLLAQATKQALAILNLSLDGLDASSKIIIRVYHELCCLIPILITNKEKMELYVKTADKAVDEKKIWRENFSFGKLNQSLMEMEENFNFEASIIEEFADLRKDDNHFYSRSVHNSFSTVMTCSYAPKSEDPAEKMEFSLFGAASIESQDTLYTLNWDTFYLLGLLYKIFVTKYNFKTNSKNELFVHAYSLYVCQKRLLLKEEFNIDIKC